MRYSNEHKAETRRRVLKEAAQEIRAKGPDGVAVAGVMARAGLTHGGFYAHFESKDAMIADAIGTMFDDARGRSDAIEQTDDPRAITPATATPSGPFARISCAASFNTRRRVSALCSFE